MPKGETAEASLLKAKAALIWHAPFFGMLMLNLKYKAVPNFGSAGVDGRTLYYDPGFVEALNFAQLKGLICHEIMHVALAHHIRRFGRDPKKWNYACDYAIDPIVQEAGFVLPEIEYMGAKYGPHIKDEFKGMSADKIYSLLPDPPTTTITITISGGEGGDPYETQGPGDVLDSPALANGQNDSPDKDNNKKELSRAEMEVIAGAEELSWKLMVNSAAHTAKMQGKLPSNLEELIEKINEPKINWIAVLRTFMTEIRKDDYSWSRGNRHHIADGLYLPSLYSEGMGEIVVAVDTSGSISRAELEQFAGELNSILEDVKPSKVHVLYCDTRIAHTEEFGPEDFPVKLHKHGGGGTDFTAPFDWTNANTNNPACLVYLTDGYGGCSADRPSYPTLWVCTSQVTDFPFGQVLPLEIDPT